MKQRFHVNPDTGRSGVCKAVKKCKFGDVASDHFDSKGEAERVYQERLAAKVKRNTTLGKEPLDIIPRVHRDMYKESDAFFNESGGVDPLAIKALASYHYYKELGRGASGLSRYEIDLKMALAKEKLKATTYGEHFNGFIYDPENDTSDSEVQEQYTPVDYSSLKDREDDELADFTAERHPDNKDPERLKDYLRDSENFINGLTPQEHNAVAYWTGCGSSIAAEKAFSRKNRWGIQSEDPTEDSYFDTENYLKTVDSAIDKSAIKPKSVLYRGLGNDIVPEDVVDEAYSDNPEKPLTEAWLAENYPVGGEIEFPMAQSSSYCAESAVSFARGHVVIEVLAHRAAATGIVSSWGASEGEYLLPRTTKYRVVGTHTAVKYTTLNFQNKANTREFTVIQLEQLE